MPDGNAYRPGDIFGSLDGKTVEIINTDAEGRLVLADALAYARELKPDLMVDNATLTGACVVALGPDVLGLLREPRRRARRAFARRARTPASRCGACRCSRTSAKLKSDVADLKHTGDRYGGSITAALFLREFVGDTPWIHCDIAGPSMANQRLRRRRQGRHRPRRAHASSRSSTTSRAELSARARPPTLPPMTARVWRRSSRARWPARSPTSR